jgi:transglutaminase-like putative cysteine protease
MCVLPPAQRGGQIVRHLKWQCKPEPQLENESHDTLGNRWLHLEHTFIDQAFCFQLELIIDNSPSLLNVTSGLPPTGRGAFLLPSALCDATPEIRALANHVRLELSPTASGLDLIDRFCEVAHSSLTYREGCTHSDTTASCALRQGAGVCQDYAHLMIALCRVSRLPARYVAGFAPGEGRMHAWVEVLCGDQWLGWDPTHARRTRLCDVAVAAGRDYRDVLPMSGTYYAATYRTATALLKVHCSTRVLDE